MIDRYDEVKEGRTKPSEEKDFIAFLFENSEIEYPDVDTEKAWEVVQSNLTNKSSSNFIWRIAASLVLVAGITITAYFLSNELRDVEVYAEKEIEEVQFPDQSIGVINKGSFITYNQNFNEKRRVKLKGEAYFDVQKSDVPFTVEVNNITLKVLGTAFNVKEEKDIIDLFVKRGEVAFLVDGKEFPVAKGQEAYYDIKKNKVVMRPTSNPNILSWQTGVLKYDKESMSQVIIDLENRYNVSFKLNNKKINNCRITATFDNFELEKVLAIINTILDVKSEINGKEIKLSGKGC